MDRISGVNYDRVEWCIAERGLSVDNLSEVLGIAASSIERLRNGEPALTYGQLRKLADYFGRGVLFFLELGDVDSEKFRSPQFRTISNMKPELSSKVMA